MIKKSHRKKLVKDPAIQYEKIHKKFIGSVKLHNYVFKSLFRVPYGYYLCPECNAIEPLRFIHHRYIKWNYIRSPWEEDCLFLRFCNICGGKGYIDFVSNAMKNDEEFSTRVGYIIPIHAAKLPIIEIASTIFFRFYNSTEYTGFDVNFKRPKLSLLKNKKTKEFVNYFSEYQKNRENRRKFITKNFYFLKSSIENKSMNSKPDKVKIPCSLCNSRPFDIQVNGYFDTIELGICGKCYGEGYQFKRDTLPVHNKYVFPIQDPSYSNKAKMLKSIIITAENSYNDLMTRLQRVQYQEKKLNNSKKRVAA
jgi:hypothetical protein